MKLLLSISVLAIAIASLVSCEKHEWTETQVLHQHHGSHDGHGDYGGHDGHGDAHAADKKVPHGEAGKKGEEHGEKKADKPAAEAPKPAPEETPKAGRDLGV